MKLAKPVYLHGLWGHPLPNEVLSNPAAGWTFLGDYPVRPIGSEAAPSAQHLLQKLLEEIPPDAIFTPPSAVYIGSARGEIARLISIYERWEKGKAQVLRSFPETTAGALSSCAAEKLRCTGYALTVSQTCISGLAALYEAVLYLVATGEMTCFGAVEAPLHPLLVESFGYLRLASRRKNFPYTLPFGENSVALSEGVVLGLVGLARSPWRIENIALRTAKEGRGTFTGLSELAFSQLLRELTEEPPDGVMLHAPGTRKGDLTELTAIEAVWGRLPAITLKPLIGHSVGASALLSLLWAQWLLTHQVWLYDSGEVRLTPPGWPTFPAKAKSGLVRPIGVDKPIKRIAILGAGFGGGVGGVILHYEPNGAGASPPTQASRAAFLA